MCSLDSWRDKTPARVCDATIAGFDFDGSFDCQRVCIMRERRLETSDETWCSSRTVCSPTFKFNFALGREIERASITQRDASLLPLARLPAEIGYQNNEPGTGATTTSTCAYYIYCQRAGFWPLPGAVYNKLGHQKCSRPFIRGPLNLAISPATRSICYPPVILLPAGLSFERAA